MRWRREQLGLVLLQLPKILNHLLTTLLRNPYAARIAPGVSPNRPLRPGDSVPYSFQVAGLGVLGSVHVLELAGFECGDSGLIVHPEDC